MLPHRDIKSDCKHICVIDVLPHLYTWCSRISIFGMCCHKNMETRMCNENTKMARERNCVSSSIVLGNAYVLKTCLKTEIRSCFSCSSSPEPLFLPETLHMSRSKAKETTCSGKNGTPQNHITIAKNANFSTSKNIKHITSLTKPLT